MTAYSVAQRTQEVGIRRALGADEGDILRLVLRQSLITVAAGVIAGSAAALALTRVLRDFLFHVSATEPAVFIGIAALFIAIASLASLIPARRAVRVDPMTALRIS
ncbi:MAG TPA: FtsX-like permease family protein [Bryobacteraceae bacterium]|nr:FtsX-like permease family protein [Bryobacteraceae bacterium]